MAEPTNRPDETQQSGAAGNPAASGGAQQQVPVNIDESKLVALYSNFCRVTGTPEEVILDFALNSQPFEPPPSRSMSASGSSSAR